MNLRQRPPRRRSQCLAILLTVVSALLVSTGTASARTPAAAKADPTYVALGDSYSSGEGLAPFVSGTDTPTDRCHRSDQAYSQRTDVKSGAFVACSGQDSGAFSTGHQSEPPQGRRLSDQTTLVSMTFGGNDLDWPGLLSACTKVERELVHTLVLPFDRQRCDNALAELPGKIDTMRSQLVDLYERTLRAAPRAQVRVLTYPPLFTASQRSGGCRIARLHPFQLVIPADVEHQFALDEQSANAAIIAVVNEVRSESGGDRLRVVDTESAFGGYLDHGHTVSCGDTGRPTPWINSARVSLSAGVTLLNDIKAVDVRQLSVDVFDVYSASFHPTAEGQRRMAAALQSTL